MNSPWQTLASLREISGEPSDPEMVQWNWLKACLQRNRDTWFGQQHDFDHIHSIEGYRAHVPLANYTDMRMPIERIAQGEADLLFAGKAIAFEQTGGSSGGGKLIPYTSESLNDFASALLPWLGDLAESHNMTTGSIYLSISPATRQPQSTKCGIPIGLPDGAYLGPTAGEALLQLSAVPSWVGEIPEINDWRLATLYWLLRSTDLALISVWSPSFFLQLLEGLRQSQAPLSRLLEQGGEIADRSLPADPAAHERFTRYRQSADSLDIWPDLKLVSCWMDGASRPLAEQLQAALPQARFQAKGLLATEGVSTLPNRRGQPVLTAQSGFYEFIRDNQCLCAWELTGGHSYELVLTTAGGLYRYRTGDLLRYEGQEDGLPVLRFLGRNDLSSDLVGEKLTDAFVSQCLSSLPGFRLLAGIGGVRPHYTLITIDDYAAEAAARLEDLEAALSTNPQYAYARKLGQLGPLTLTPHPDPLSRYTELAARHQRLGDVKVPALLPPTIPIDQFLEDIP